MVKSLSAVKQVVQLLQIQEVCMRLYFTAQNFCRLLPVFSTGSTLALFQAQDFEQRSEDRSALLLFIRSS